MTFFIIAKVSHRMIKYESVIYLTHFIILQSNVNFVMFFLQEPYRSMFDFTVGDGVANFW